MLWVRMRRLAGVPDRKRRVSDRAPTGDPKAHGTGGLRCLSLCRRPVMTVTSQTKGERLPNLRLLDILAYEAQAIEQDLRARFKDAHTLVVRPLDQADTDAG